MQVTYYNRYNDKIIFEQVDDATVIMSGHNPEWLRYGFPNDYIKAYGAYCYDIKNSSQITFNEFKKAVHDYRENWTNPLEQYRSLVTSRIDIIDMIDPSGGPYISVDMDLESFFNDKISRIITEININNDKITFTIKNKL
jgi:hypothetical protein